MQPKRFGDLDAWLVPSLATRHESSHGVAERSVSSCVVLLHGYGAPGTDLVSLADAIEAPPGTWFVFPQAPHSMSGGPPRPDEGRAWWPIDMMRLQLAALTGRLEGLADEHPPGMDAARRTLSGFLDALLTALDLPGERLVLGGFSQGAMLACDLTLRETRPLAGLVLLSGTTLCQDEWFPLLPRRAGLPVFQSHSPDDPILPFSLAERLHQAFHAAGARIRFVPFSGGHGIGRPVIDELGTFLEETIGSSSSIP